MKLLKNINIALSLILTMNLSGMQNRTQNISAISSGSIGSVGFYQNNMGFLWGNSTAKKKEIIFIEWLNNGADVKQLSKDEILDFTKKTFQFPYKHAEKTMLAFKNLLSALDSDDYEKVFTDKTIDAALDVTTPLEGLTSPSLEKLKLLIQKVVELNNTSMIQKISARLKKTKTLYIKTINDYIDMSDLENVALYGRRLEDFSKVKHLLQQTLEQAQQEKRDYQQRLKMLPLRKKGDTQFLFQ